MATFIPSVPNFQPWRQGKKRCQCSKDCKAAIKGFSDYARGHNPRSRCDKERGKKIRKTIKRLYREGKIVRDHSYMQTEAYRESLRKGWQKKLLIGDFCRTYRTGIRGSIFSKKLHKKLFFRSFLERRFIKYLEANKKVSKYGYEEIAIPYMCRGRQHTYFPDFVIKWKTVPWTIVEIKPDAIVKKNYYKEVAKIKAGYAYARKKRLRYLVVGETWLERRGY